ncbi:MAG TPA: alpha/beta hydrolase [Kofleriaceae bacterium]|jgi:pimeloyl-ACP methyl ester carboxylesterase|nr:alpha/beta hydrolase [Kofleriaceae bacterium]
MSILTLARWLGPWADATKAPPAEVRDEVIGGLHVRTYVQSGTDVRTYQNASKSAPFVIAPGLHYAGADDPRLDRFCRILAAGGHRVVAPFVPSYLALEPDQRAIDDFVRCCDELPRCVAFSISFGSLLVFAAAAERPDKFERLVVFGGYADFIDAMRFCLTGERRDPLNQPVVLMNLLDHIDHDRAHTAALKAAWRQYVESTWGRPELKVPERYLAIAEQLAPSVPADVRELFLAGIRPGAWPVAEPALALADRRDLEPARFLAHVRGRVDLVHGADDDVIPVEHVHRLAAGLVNADVRVHVTGLYGHTGAGFGKLAALPRELATMLRVLRAL